MSELIDKVGRLSTLGPNKVNREDPVWTYFQNFAVFQGSVPWRENDFDEDSLKSYGQSKSIGNHGLFKKMTDS